MRLLRRITIVFALALLWVHPAAAQQGIRVTVTPDQLPAKRGQTATVVIDIDIPTTPPDKPRPIPGSGNVDPAFTVGVSQGTLTQKSITGGKFWGMPGSTMLGLDRNADEGRRAVGRVEFTYQTPDKPQQGEVSITVQGSQGRSLLGQTHAVSKPVFQGTGRLLLKKGAGAATGPGRRPPFGPTGRAVNPPIERLKKAARNVATLAIATLVIYAIRRKRLKRGPKKPDIPPIETKPDIPIIEKPKPREPERAQQGELVLHADSYTVDGSADEWITLTATAISAEGGTATIVQAQFGASRPGYEAEPFQVVDLRSVRADLGPSTRQARVHVPWEWRDVEVEFTVEATVAGWPARAHGSCPPVRVVGAKPKVVVESDPPSVCATGREGVELKAELWLFDNPAPETEKVRISRAFASTDAAWDHLSSNGNESAANPTRGTWIPPFLLQEPDYVEEAEVEVTCEWIGGALWKRAAHSSEGLPSQYGVFTATQEVMISGCRAIAQPETDEFVPLPGTELVASGRLMDAQGNEIGNPLEFGAVHSADARIRCEVRDRSQGLPKLHNRCKLPPSEPTPFVMQRAIEVDERGRFCGPDREPRIVFDKYQLREGCEPIHHGPVEYLLVIDDGFGGRAELRGGSRATLGSLVMETGGADFRIYENRAHCMDLEYQSDYFPPGECRLDWSFAVVDAQTGEPLNVAGSAVNRATIDPNHRKSEVIIGHTAPDHDIYVEPTTAEVRYVKPGAGAPPGGWRRVDDAARERAARLRGTWHGLRADYGAPATGLPGLSPRPSKTWRKMALALSVRVEMRDEQGHLLATSDRMMPGDVRTPSEDVWSDHRFKLVFRLPIVFIPGFEGSQLNQGAERLWPPPSLTPDDNFKNALKKLADGPEIRAVDLVYQVGDGEVYRGLIQGLMAELGYWEPGEGANPSPGSGRHLGLSVMPYDWRLDNRAHEPELARKIDELLKSYYPAQIEPQHRWVLVLAHDMGGLIAWHFGRNDEDRFPFTSAGTQAGEEGLTGEQIWNDHVGACVMLGSPAMGAAEPLFSLLTGRAPAPGQQGGSTLLDQINKDGTLDDNIRELLGNQPSVYQLFAPYHSCIRVDAEGMRVGQPVAVDELQEVVDACVAGILQQQVGLGNVVVNLAAALSSRFDWGTYIKAYPSRAQPVSFGDDGRVVLWPNQELVQLGRDFHDEKGPQPPRRCLMIYGKGAQAVDAVTVRIEAKHAIRFGLQLDLWGGIKEFAVDLVTGFMAGRFTRSDVKLLPDLSAGEAAPPDSMVRISVEHAPQHSLELAKLALRQFGVPISATASLWYVFKLNLSLAKVITMELVDAQLGPGDGGVPDWSLLERDEWNAVDLQSDVPFYGIPLGSGGDGDQAIGHRTLGSHATVQELLRSILAGSMPDPDAPTPPFGYPMQPRSRFEITAKKTPPIAPTAAARLRALVAGAWRLKATFDRAERVILRGVAGGEELIKKFGTTAPDKEDSLIQEAKIAIEEANAGATDVMIGHKVYRRGSTKELTEIDVETDTKIIQVKGGDYSRATRLSKGDLRQFIETKRYNEQMLVGPGGNKLPPKKIVYHFTDPIHPDLKKWLESKGVVEVRIGRLK